VVSTRRRWHPVQWPINHKGSRTDWGFRQPGNSKQFIKQRRNQRSFCVAGESTWCLSNVRGTRETGGILGASGNAAWARCRNAIPRSTAAASWLGRSFREARRCREVGERASRGGGLGNSRTLGMKVRSAAQTVARDMVGRYGRDAPRNLRERAASAEEYGDDSEAAAWREIADIADRISERR